MAAGCTTAIEPHPKGYGFGIVGERGGTAPIRLVYPTEAEAEAARNQFDVALSKTVEVEAIAV